ncbi:delta(12)-fatty-acid desaturase FAD2-like [Cynara cardunculus var. scolymus]|uniref:Fatty acid desaturase, type 1 n=1 Tax=Cynara cardunculus var. scolymus TaxID=59895 RepID=A0A124SIA1_CYNCS|nr:delta(12)-fatty-acid desaturase FAD2-like [Cynara cardunculus var. scolymus]KVI12046.1 Fatty acid desaturase, type 1 [Cynara cardunculus var. scolymus]
MAMAGDQNLEESYFEGFKRSPATKPPFTLGDVKKAIPPHCFQRPMIKSFSYLFRDIISVAILYHLATTYIPNLPHPLPYFAWPLYWCLQGFMFMAIWVLGHECGHHAFSDYSWLDDTVGFVIHSFVFTPFFSWKLSHRRHHLNTGSLERDEVYVPKRKSKRGSVALLFNNTMGLILTLAIKLSLGWYIYLSINAAGRPYDRFASHYDPQSPIFSDNERVLIVLSDIGLLSMIYMLYTWATIQGFGWVFCVYGGPLMVMNAFLVTVTYLQHTHLSLPRFDDSGWNWINGALSTVDRDFGFLNKVFHNVTDTHVVHHLFSYLPHYHAMEATKAMVPILGEYYQFDKTPFMLALWRESKKCVYVEPDEDGEKNKGIYWYNYKY